MNRILYNCLSALTMFMSLSSCDEGRIYPEESKYDSEGMTVTLSAKLNGTESLPNGYTVCLAGFNKQSDYAVINKKIKGGNVDGFTLSNVPTDIDVIEVCILNNIRLKLKTLYKYECDKTGRDIDIVIDEPLECSGYGVIQTEIFNNSCVACHGGSTKAAAGLYLTEGKSYNAIVNVKSTKSADSLNIIKKGDSDNSYMYRMINGNVPDGELRYYHGNILTDYTLIDFMKNWIESVD